MAKRRIKGKESSEEYLTFDQEIYNHGGGRIYSLLQRISFPGFLAAILEMALLNAGINLNNYTPAVFYILMTVTIIYVVPSVFVLPTAWFLKSWRQKLLRESYVELREKELIYHKVMRFEKGSAVRIKIFCSNIYHVEKKCGSYVVEGKTSEPGKNLRGRGLKIPVAFKNMDKLENLAK